MLLEEKLWFVQYIKTIEKLTKWDLVVVKYIKYLLQDNDPKIMIHHDDLLEIVLKIVSTRPVINYVKLTHPHIEFEEFNELVRDLINIYLMRQEDFNRINSK